MSAPFRLKEQPPCALSMGSPQVKGAGGWNIFHHCGVSMALRDHGLHPSKRLGVSAGSFESTLLENGYSPEQNVDLFLQLKKDRNNPVNMMLGLRIADPVSMSIGGVFSLRPHFERLVTELKLKPTKTLHILACDFFTREPVLFKGEDMDLVTALTASGSPPWIAQPVWHMHDGRLSLLVDGAVYHYNPTQFFDEPCIVSRFTKATQLPSEWETWFDLYVSAREIFYPVAGNNRYVDETKHLVIETGMPNVAGLNGGISDATCLKMVENAYNVADKAISEAKAAGRLCPCE